MPALVLEQVIVQQHQNLVGMDKASLVVDDAQSVGVAVGGDAEVRVLLQHRSPQRAQRLHIRRGQATAEERVVPLMDDVDVAAGGEQNGLQRRAAHAVHRVEDDMQVAASDGVHVYPTDDGIQVRVLRVDLLHQPRRHGLFIGNDADLALVHTVGGVAQLVGHGLLRVAPALGEHLHTVVNRGVMAGGNRHAIGQAIILDRKHDQRRRRLAADKEHVNALPRHDLRGPLRRLAAQKPAVVADAEALVLNVLRLDAQGQGPHELLNVELGKSVADDGAPSARTERNHLQGTSVSQKIPFLLYHAASAK